MVRPGRRVGAALAVLLFLVAACAAPAPTPPPTPTPEPTPIPPLAGDPWVTPFLDRPISEPIRHQGDCDNLLIEGLAFEDLGPGVEAIHLEDCDNVVIRANDFARVSQAITVLDSTRVRVEYNRYEDILGPHERNGTHRANFVQFVRVTNGYIGNNKGKGGDTEDIVSLFRSGGTADDPLIVEHNHFEGTDWTSQSGSGIALGDGESSYSIARDNVLLNVGQAGIFIAGGTNHKIIDNVILGEQRQHSNVGIYVDNRSDGECGGHEVRGNEVNWMTEDGDRNSRYDSGDCGEILGWDENEWTAPLRPDALRVGL
jgi:hypothetical protein